MNSLSTVFVLSLVIFIAVYTRCIGLEYPPAIVFDELHYASICKLYKNEQFHYDRQPPLFNIVLCKALLLSNAVNFNQSWVKVGQTVPSSFCLWCCRLLPSIFGIFSILISYKIVLLLKFTKFASFIASFLIAFDNSLILQSRLMLPDAFQHLLLLLCLFFVVKNTALTVLVSHVIFGLALSTHYSSLSLYPVVFFTTSVKAWEISTNIKIPMLTALLKSCLYLLSAFIVPAFVYFSVILLHVSLVSGNGPHALLMSSAFRASLHGGIKNIQDIVTYGSCIHLRGTDDIKPYGRCYLRSFYDNYPVTYKDGRRSSVQQLVSCCLQTSVNSCWMIMKNPLNHTKYGQPVFDNDVVLLMHNQTGHFLNTQPVAAPVSKFRQEVSCRINYNKIDIPYLEWQVLLLKSKSTNRMWCNFDSYVYLQHKKTKAYLTVSGSSLPSWGKCNEVVGEENNNLEFETSPWNAEIVAPDGTYNQCSTNCRSIGLIGKTIEYIWFAFSIKLQTITTHRFSSYWYQWLLGSVTIAYWHDSKTNSQLQFIGNVVSWIGGLLLFIFLACYFVFLVVCKQLQMPQILRQDYKKIQLLLCVIGSGWILHILYYIFSDEFPSFVFQYLPAVIYLHILQACAIEVFCHCDSFVVFLFVFQYLVCVIFCYYSVRPLTYGFPNITKQHLKKLKIWDTWDLIV